MKQRARGVVAVLGSAALAVALLLGSGCGGDSSVGGGDPSTAGGDSSAAIGNSTATGNSTAAGPSSTTGGADSAAGGGNPPARHVSVVPGAAATAPSVRRHPRRPVSTLAAQPIRGRSSAILEVRKGAQVALLTAPGGRLVKALGDQSEFGSPLILGVVRQRGSWLAVTTPLLPNGRLGWVRFDAAKLALYWTRYWLRVELAKRVLELRYGRRTLARYMVTVGAPGSGTPRGRFSITDALTYRPASPSYGCCALALSGHQEHLPVGWLGGDRIAIHGTPGPVGEAASHGCIRASDRTMRTLFRRVPLGTPVFVRS